MEYPRDFPEHLKRPVDAAIHSAEIAFIDAKQLIVAHRFQYEAERLILRYIESVFFAFAAQVVEAGKEGLWNGERIRKALPEFLDDLGHHVWFDKHPDPGAYHASEQFKKTLEKESRDWKGWRAVHEGLKEVAELPEPSREIGGPAIHVKPDHRGYAKQIWQWIEREDLETVECAARRLHLSKSALKSMMSSKGKPRYSQETLDRVLREINHEKEG